MAIKKTEEIKPDYNFLMGYWIGIEKKWWRGVENVTFIWMGAWNDPLVGYRGYAINVHDVEDAMWEEFNEEAKGLGLDVNSDEDFNRYCQDNACRVYEYLDDIIAYHEKEVA